MSGIRWLVAPARLAFALCLMLAIAPAEPPDAGASVPAHVATWAYDDSTSPGLCNGGYGPDAAQERQLVERWVTYAETNCGGKDPKAAGDCHSGGRTFCTVMQYLDANKVYTARGSGSLPIPPSANERWWVHGPACDDATGRPSCTAVQRIGATSPEFGPWRLLNQMNPAVDAWIASYARRQFESSDGLMLDDTAGTLRQQLSGARCAPRDALCTVAARGELRTDADVLEEHEALAGLLTKTDGAPFLQVDNGLSTNPDVKPSVLRLLHHPSSVIGLIAEGVPWNDGEITPDAGLPDPVRYADLLDDMAYIDLAERPREFLALLSHDVTAPENARLVQEATVLLGFSPGHTVDWADLEDSNEGDGNLDLAIWPEEGIYPSEPVQTMRAPAGAGCMRGVGMACATGGHNSVQVPWAPTGIYRREFRRCYDRAAAIGSCAAVVNDTARCVTVQASWFTLSYDWKVTLNVPAGTTGDVQSGGTIFLRGVPFVPGDAPSATLLPYHAMLVTGRSGADATPRPLFDPAGPLTPVTSCA